MQRAMVVGIVEPCPTCGARRGVPEGDPAPASGHRGAYAGLDGAPAWWAWRCPVCEAEGCGACAGGHACTRSFPLCFAHRLPMALAQCWCCAEQTSGLVCPACIGGACARCWRRGCRPGARRCEGAARGG